MPLIYITGLAGSGKTTVCRALKEKGYEAHDADREGFSNWYNIKTGKKTYLWYLNKKIIHTKKWESKYSWNLNKNKVEKLAKKSNSKLIFLCGINANEKQLFYLFDKVVFLIADAKTLKNRLTSRTNNNYGKAPHELNSVLKWQKDYPNNYSHKKTYKVNAAQQVDKIVKKILEIAE